MNLKDLGIDEKDPRPVIVIVGSPDDEDIAEALAKITAENLEAKYQIVCVNDEHELEKIHPGLVSVEPERGITIRQIGLRKALAETMPAVELIAMPAERTKCSFDEPFLLKTIDHSVNVMYDPYVKKKGKNSWKQQYKYHQ
jgi:hypothetical protein